MNFSFFFDRSIKNLADIKNKINMVVGNYEPKTKVELENKKSVISIFNEIRYDLPDYYLDPNNIVQLHKSFERDRRVSILSKYLKKMVVQ